MFSEPLRAKSDTIEVGDAVKWKRLYSDGYVIYWGHMTEIEVGAEIPQAHVQPKGGGHVQRIDHAILLRANDPSEPQPLDVDLLKKRDGGLPRIPFRWPVYHSGELYWIFYCTV